MTHIETSSPYRVMDRLLKHGCPVCGAKARQVKERRTCESWRVHCYCRSRFVGWASSVEIEQACQYASAAEMQRLLRRIVSDLGGVGQ